MSDTAPQQFLCQFWRQQCDLSKCVAPYFKVQELRYIFFQCLQHSQVLLFLPKHLGKSIIEYQQRVKSCHELFHSLSCQVVCESQLDLPFFPGLILKSSFFEIMSPRSMQMLCKTRHGKTRSSFEHFLGCFHTSSLELCIFPLHCNCSYPPSVTLLALPSL